MALTDSASVKLKGFNESVIAVPSGVTFDQVVADAIEEASIRLTRWVGATSYAGAETDPDSDIGKALKRAETQLTLAELVNYVTPEKIANLGSYRIEGAVSESVQAVDIKSADTLAAGYIAKAEQLAAPWIILDSEELIVAKGHHHGCH